MMTEPADVNDMDEPDDHDHLLPSCRRICLRTLLTALLTNTGVFATISFLHYASASTDIAAFLYPSGLSIVSLIASISTYLYANSRQFDKQLDKLAQETDAFAEENHELSILIKRQEDAVQQLESVLQSLRAIFDFDGLAAVPQTLENLTAELQEMASKTTCLLQDEQNLNTQLKHEISDLKAIEKRLLQSIEMLAGIHMKEGDIENQMLEMMQEQKMMQISTLALHHEREELQREQADLLRLHANMINRQEGVTKRLEDLRNGFAYLLGKKPKK